MTEVANAFDKNGYTTTKERIIDAAIGLFSEKGFEAVSMNEIAAVVGIKKASIYFHFRSKEEIMEAIFEIFNETIVHTGIRDETYTDHLLDTVGLEGLMNTSMLLILKLGNDPKLGKIWRITTLEASQNKKFRAIFMKNIWEKPIATWEMFFGRAMEKKLIKSGDPKLLAMEYFAFTWFAFVEHNLLRYNDTLAGKPVKSWEAIPQHVKFLMDKIKA